MAEPLKRFAAGIDWTRWCIGLQIHDVRRKYGFVIAEINIMPLKFFLRFGDGMKKLHCMYCGKFLCKIDPSESELASCMDCYRRNREDGA